MQANPPGSVRPRNLTGLRPPRGTPSSINQSSTRGDGGGTSSRRVVLVPSPWTLIALPNHTRPPSRVFFSILLPPPTNRTVASTMSSSTAGQTPSMPPSDLNSILDAALSEYKKTTGAGLLEHPLAKEVKKCDSIRAISAILQDQAREFQQFKDGNQRIMKWIDPMVDALSTFSETLGGAASIVRPEIPVRSHLRYILMLRCRHSLLQAPSLLGLEYSCLSVFSQRLFVDLS